MKTKKTIIVSASLKLLLVLPVILIVLVAFSSCAAKKKVATVHTEIAPPPPPPPPPPQQNSALKDNVKVAREVVTDESDQEPFVVVEEMPQFPGGDTELLKYIAENTKYPETAKKNNIQGRVIIRFCITAKGNVNLVTVIKGVDSELDAEAIRVVSTLPAFKPGRQGGKDVPVWYMVPITFTLNGDGPQRPSRYEVIGNDTVYSYTKEMPQFPGGNDVFQKFKTENVKYPPEVKNLGIEGVVFIRFIIEKNGSVSNAKIMQGASPSLDAEAIRVTKLMPAWQPGKENGKPVKFMFMTNFDFLLTPRTPPVYEEGTPFVVVEQMPMFPGGDSLLLKYISENTKYPESAKANGIQGRVVIRFCVTDVGGVDRISVLKGVDPELDAEAIRVVKTLPTFKPGKQGGKPVNVWYMVPITFALSKPAAETGTNPSAKTPSAPPKQEITGYDVAPVFPGGETAINKFINSKLAYPKAAKEKNISGKVILRFCINTDGSIDQVSVLKGVDPELNAEAVRVFKLLPSWKPGKLAGTPVKVWYSMPVIFTLK
ncbi:MAG: TonB family protein [Bacteroidetes bacterium]|nr:TonB family protein [Bacteroidota bacterium]